MRGKRTPRKNLKEKKGLSDGGAKEKSSNENGGRLCKGQEKLHIKMGGEGKKRKQANGGRVETKWGLKEETKKRRFNLQDKQPNDEEKELGNTKGLQGGKTSETQ